MKPILFILPIFITTQIIAQPMKTLEKISWHGQAAISIDNGGQKIYIDPYKIKHEDSADLILITHSHGDHLSADDIAMVVTEKTKFVCPHNCIASLEDLGYRNITGVAPGDLIVVDGTEILAVPMYNIVKTNFHPRENKWTGYIIDVGGVKVYHAGDTERIPEMKEVECDIVFLPLGQTYTMNSVEEAADAALDTGAEIAVPIHYGLYEGTKEDALKFKDILAGKMEVVIMGE